MDYLKRSPGVWIGLAAALMVILACICGLVLISGLAAYRGSQTEMPATPVGDPSGLSLTPSSPTRPVLLVPTLPLTNAGWPIEDVPMPAEADLGTLVGSADSFSVITDQDFKEVLDFYQAEMEAQGWLKVDYGTRITPGDAELHYRKDDTNLIVILARIPFVGTLVHIHVQPA